MPCTHPDTCIGLDPFQTCDEQTTPTTITSLAITPDCLISAIGGYGRLITQFSFWTSNAVVLGNHPIVSFGHPELKVQIARISCITFTYVHSTNVWIVSRTYAKIVQLPYPRIK